MNNCKKCNDKGFFLAENSIYTTTCDCVTASVINKKYNLAQIPKKHQNLEISDWNLKQSSNGRDLSPSQIKTKEEAYVSMTKILDSFEYPYSPYSGISSMVFDGSKSSGKSLCLSLFAKQAIAKGAEVFYYDWYDLCGILDRFTNKEDIDEVVEKFKDYDLICIDGIDFDTKINAPCKMQLNRIFKYRINQELWTICSTSLVNQKFIFEVWNDYADCSQIIKLI